MVHRLIVLSIASLQVGCLSLVTGDEGNLEFSYAAYDDLATFDKPIAVGARLNLQVREVGTRAAVSLTSAQSGDPAVLGIESFTGQTVVLRGTASGASLISVGAVLLNGTTVTDSVTLRARVPEVQELHHSCTSGADGLYLVNQEVWLIFELKMANGDPVIGYGYHPVDVSPVSGLTLDSTGESRQLFYRFHRFQTSTTPQAVTVTSQVDSTTVTMTLVDPGDIDGAMLAPFLTFDVNERNPRVGDLLPYHVLPTIRGTPVCQPQTPFTAVSDSPSVCSVDVVATTPATPDQVHADLGWITVTGIAAGQCDFTVTYPAGNGGAGVSVQLTKTVDPP